jgi:hypothetical protein
VRTKLRYVVGNDATKTLEARKDTSDKEFGNLIKDQFNIQIVILSSDQSLEARSNKKTSH